jgi:hypothetical protein
MTHVTHDILIEREDEYAWYGKVVGGRVTLVWFKSAWVKGA